MPRAPERRAEEAEMAENNWHCDSCNRDFQSQDQYNQHNREQHSQQHSGGGQYGQGQRQ